MLKDSAAWAHGVDRNFASCVATAIGKVVVPWMADWQTWRRHAAEFFDRLCAHRQYRAESEDTHALLSYAGTFVHCN